MSKFDRDRLNNASPAEVSTATYALVDALYNQKPHIQAAAAAVLFLTVADLWRLPPQDIFTAVKNMLDDDIAGERPEFRALRLYAQHELKDGQ